MGAVGEPPKTWVNPSQIFIVSLIPPASVGTFGSTARNKVSVFTQLLLSVTVTI